MKRVSIPPPKTLTVTQCHALLDGLIVNQGTTRQFRRGVRNYTMGVLLLETGLRVNELVQLVLDDVWYIDGPVTELSVRPDIAKNKKGRRVPVSSRLSAALTTAYEKLWSFDGIEPYDYIFYQSDPKEHVTTRQVQRIMMTAAREARIRHCTPHVLRHTFATRVLARSNLRFVQQLLGHSSVLSTQIYTHPDSENLRKAVEGD